ncbi:MAG TPA: protein-L-isoaspartate O-methyltransferase [Rhodocyclaceae bacterium]
MNLEQARFNMVEQQIRPCEVLDQNVLDLMSAVRREDFVPAAYRNLAYADTEIPLGNGAAMLPPRIEAQALQALALKKHEKVLEIGTGSGFMAALLAAHADQVWSIEVAPALADRARENLRNAGIGNVAVETGDGLRGLSAHAPYDVIVVSGAVTEISEELLAQLKVKGRLFAIVGQVPVMEAVLVTRVAEQSYSRVNLFETAADYLKGGAAKPAFKL